MMTARSEKNKKAGALNAEKKSAGQAMTEYIIVVACISLVFISYSEWMAKAVGALFDQVVMVFRWPIP